MKEPFFAKVQFKDFIAHYRRMTPQQIAADVADSMEALEANDPKGKSFGAKLVRIAIERANSPEAVASRNNGAKGGRPLRLPTWTEFMEFVNREGLDYIDAREWWEMSIVDRGGKDRDGKLIRNWIAALRNFCKSKIEKRSA